MTVTAVPAVTLLGVMLTTKWLAVPAKTATGLLAQVIVVVAVSVAVTVWLPAVLRVTLNVPVPLVKVALAGTLAWPSELVSEQCRHRPARCC